MIRPLPVVLCAFGIIGPECRRAARDFAGTRNLAAHASVPVVLEAVKDFALGVDHKVLALGRKRCVVESSTM